MSFLPSNLLDRFSSRMGRLNLQTSDGSEETPSTSPTFPLLQLPPEILNHILPYLTPVALAALCCTCRSLKSLAEDEYLWARKLADVKLRNNGLGPSPFGTWKELYAAHYPYWFLPKHKIWFSDKATTDNNLVGQLILARYDYRMGSIEAYRLVAEHPDNQIFYHWEWDPDVIIHKFNPKVRLHLDDPIIKLDPGVYGPGGRMKKEVKLQGGITNPHDAIKACIFPAIAIPPSRQISNMVLWPPATLPATERVRSDSSTLFHDNRHKPSCYEEVSQTTFRIRKWLDLGGFGGPIERFGLKMGEDVMTWSTLPMECYTPTVKKPYQGIWVGDYAGHGCEFLVLIQKTEEEAHGIPSIKPTRDPWMPAIQAFPGATQIAIPNEAGPDHRPEIRDSVEDSVGCTGRLEAIKLTGDPNIPRGEYTWIAEDIGPNGVVRVATERIFKGARIVKSVGHIAGNNFMEGKRATRSKGLEQSYILEITRIPAACRFGILRASKHGRISFVNLNKY